MANLIQISEDEKGETYRVCYSFDCNAGYLTLGPCCLNSFARDLIGLCKGKEVVYIKNVDSECYRKLPKEKIGALEALLRREVIKFNFI